MSDAPPEGPYPGAPHMSYSTPAATNPSPRRSSYASVAAGIPTYTASDNPTSSIPGSRTYSATNPVPSVQLPRIGGGEQPSRIPQPISEADLHADGGINISGIGGRNTGTMANHPTRRPSSQSVGNSGGGVTEFFRPSYLVGTTYLEKLEASHEAKIAAQAEEMQNRPYNPGSLSKSSSSVSLQKMAPSHRGMTYDIVENPMLVIEDGPSPLPSRWAQVDKWGGLEVGPDGFDVKYVGAAKLSEHEAAAARTDHPMPSECGIYYYEISVLQKGKDGLIGVGFSSIKASLEKLPGWEPDSWAYHGDDGMSFCCQSTGKPYGPQFTTGDVIGCGVNFLTNQAFFTKNGHFLNNAFKDIRDVKLYPSIGMKRPNAHLEANFGQRPFVFDIDQMFKNKQLQITEDIKTADVSVLHPAFNKADLCKALVAQYLSHDGYNETARAFAREARSEKASLYRSSDTPSLLDHYLAAEEDHDAANRQQIRTAILEGLIDEAISLTDRHYPGVLNEYPLIYFRLKCRKFVEMMRLSTEYLDAASKGPTTSPQKLNKKGSVNGHHATAHSDDELEPDMDLDDPPIQVTGKHIDQDWDRMETEEHQETEQPFSATFKHQELLQEIIQYGRELKQQFKEDQSKLVTDTMTEIFGMLAYSDPRESEQAHLLETYERVPVAEALNSAILVSIGKSPSTALERLFKQTVVLTDLIGEDGGVGAFVNVRNILRAVAITPKPSHDLTR